MLRRGRVGLVEPAAGVRLLEDQDAAGRDEPAVDLELLGGAAEGGELEARVDDIEAGGRQRGVEEVVDRQAAGVEDAGILGEVEVVEQRARGASQTRACNVVRRCSMPWVGRKAGEERGTPTSVAPHQSYR